MIIRTISSKKILTKQKAGFLTEGAYPYTHTLSWSAGCGLGKTYCGKYCYAQTLPNWLYNKGDDAWGEAVIIKENAPELLAKELSDAKNREVMRIFMSSVTDPYQPIERKVRMTRRCLDVFAQYDDLDLLVIQTRSPLVKDDLARIANIPYVWLSMTLETDRGDLLYGPNEAQIQQRYETMQLAVEKGVQTQITVSPCLPYSDHFADWLEASGVGRIVVDTFVQGDGSEGKRTAQSPFADVVEYDWQNDDPARALYDELVSRGLNVGWSSAGFVGIPPRQSKQSAINNERSGH